MIKLKSLLVEEKLRLAIPSDIRQLYTLFKKCLNTDNGDKEKNLLNKLIKTLNNSNKKLNNNLQDLQNTKNLL